MMTLEEHCWKRLQFILRYIFGIPTEQVTPNLAPPPPKRRKNK
jgi:hypothetical protein